MHDLEITWPGGQLRFSPEDSPVLIGRSSSAAVVVPQGTVSRRHLTMNWNGRSWQAEDTSTHGSFDPIGVRLAPSWTLGTDVVVRLGSPRGVELAMRLITKALDGRAQLDPYADPESPPTVVDFGPPPPLDSSSGPSALLRVAEHDPQPAHESRPAEPVGADFDGPMAAEQLKVGDPAMVAGPAPIETADAADPGLAPSQEPVEPEDLGVFAERPVPVAVEDPVEEFDDSATVDGPIVDLTSVDSTGGPLLDLDGSGPPSDDDAADHQLFPVDDATASDSVGWLNPPDQQAMPAAQSPHLATSAPDDEGPVVLGQPAPDQSYNPAATFVETDTLRLQIDGEDYVFLPGHEVTIGRDPSCLVTVDERHSLVSRRHLRFVHSQGVWWLEDASSKGTYIHGRRLNRPYKAEGAFIAQLGDPTAGTQLRVVTAGQHRKPTNRAGVAIAAVAAAALVIAAVVAWLVLRGDDSQAEALATAKQSTVMLASDAGHGTGFFVSESMIVTNQHVAAMADQLVVAVSPEVDEPAEIRYVATLAENHPFLDIAVVRITNEAAVNESGSVTIGAPVAEADVPLLQLGDSSAVTIGDSVTSIGFPGRFSVSSSDDAGMLRLAAVTSTSGQAANFTSWPGCGSPDLSSFIPPDAPATVTCSADGNIEKGVLLASFPSGEGASGSAVLHDDQVVAVLFAGDSEDATASRSITTNAFADWLNTVLTSSG